mgnify:CR=1 FL=1
MELNSPLPTEWGKVCWLFLLRHSDDSPWINSGASQSTHVFTTTTLCFDGSVQAQNGVAPVGAVGTFNLTHGDKVLLYHKRLTTTMFARKLTNAEIHPHIWRKGNSFGVFLRLRTSKELLCFSDRHAFDQRKNPSQKLKKSIARLQLNRIESPKSFKN